MLSIHLRLGLPSGLFPSGFPQTQNKKDVKTTWKKEVKGKPISATGHGRQ
jgi:hypothetical protein